MENSPFGARCHRPCGVRSISSLLDLVARMNPKNRKFGEPGPPKRSRNKVSKLAVCEPTNQAERIIQKFGGPIPMAEALSAVGYNKRVTAIYKWTHDRDKGGAGGMIPNSVHAIIRRAARLQGILLTPADWYD